MLTLAVQQLEGFPKWSVIGVLGVVMLVIAKWLLWDDAE